jgi:hypothetical protein
MTVQQALLELNAEANRIAEANQRNNKHMTTHVWNCGRDLSPDEIKQLEDLIDSAGIESVLMALSGICGEKAEHIALIEHDTTLAKRWATVEGALGTTVCLARGL